MLNGVIIMTKKGAIEIEKLVAFIIGLIVLAVIVFSFVGTWGDGEDTTRDMMDYESEDCEDGVRNPVTGECLGGLILGPWILKRLFKERYI